VVEESYAVYSESLVSDEDLFVREIEAQQAETQFNFASQLKGRMFQTKAMPHLQLNMAGYVRIPFRSAFPARRSLKPLPRPSVVPPQISNRLAYPEPIRDRDKNWGGMSQRYTLDRAGPGTFLDMPPLPLGTYDPGKLAVPRLVWCPPFQSLVRRTIMRRQAGTISASWCVFCGVEQTSFARLPCD